MQIKINAKEFIKIVDISYVINYEYKLIEFKEEDNLIIGKVNIFLEYFLNNNDGFKKEDFTFEFQIMNDKYEINKLIIQDLKIQVLDNQGINVDYDILLDYEVRKEVEETPLIIEEIKIKDEEILEKEKLKDEIISEIDEKLKESLIKEDVLEQDSFNELQEIEEEVKPVHLLKKNSSYKHLLKSERKTNYKVIYVEDEVQIENIANKYNKPIKDLYRDNNYDVKKRIIIKL